MTGNAAPPDVAARAVALGASQDEAELTAAIVAVQRVRPAVIVEIGCDRGGTLYAWRQVCPWVLGITTEDNGYASGGSGRLLVSHGAMVRTGDSHRPETRAWLVRTLLGQPVDVLVIDGDHSAAGVRADLADYGPLVRAGGLIMLHDIAPSNDPRGADVAGVWAGLWPQYQTGEIRLAASGYGWGLIRVRAGDRFDQEG